MAYPRLPAASREQQKEVRRSLGYLFHGVKRSDSILNSRKFRIQLLVVLNVLDVFTTAIVLASGGAEGNPAMAPLIDSWWKPIAAKGIVLAFVGFVALRCSLKSRVADVLLVSAWLFYAGVVGWNTLLIVRM